MSLKSKKKTFFHPFTFYNGKNLLTSHFRTFTPGHLHSRYSYGVHVRQRKHRTSGLTCSFWWRRRCKWGISQWWYGKKENWWVCRSKNFRSKSRVLTLVLPLQATSCRKLAKSHQGQWEIVGLGGPLWESVFLCRNFALRIWAEFPKEPTTAHSFPLWDAL